MRWLILTILLFAADAPVRQPAGKTTVPPSQLQTANPDILYADREHLPSALAAAAAWEARLAGSARDFEAAWKLARACYWLGGHVPAADRRRQYERGIQAGKRAAAIEPRRPDGHFWTAANMGAMAESFGLRAGLQYRGPVKRELETVLAIDPSYQQGSADRALGRWYLRVPGWLGGSKTKSVQHLERSIAYDPGNAASHYFLAETYLEMGRQDDARRELQKVLEAPLQPEWVPEIREFEQKAMALLQSTRDPRSTRISTTAEAVPCANTSSVSRACREVIAVLSFRRRYGLKREWPRTAPTTRRMAARTRSGRSIMM